MDAVGTVDVGVTGRAEHHGIARGPPAKTVRGRFGVVIGLDLDDHPTHAVEEERRTDQVGRDPVNAASEERGVEWAGI
jgi:hypothetical protein